jgi:2-haloacid dehalogenase
VIGQLRLNYVQEAAEEFGTSVGDWPAYPDSAESLGRLKALGLKLVVLSNVNNESFDR